MISDLLENQGYETWYFNRDILADAYPKKIVKALRTTKIFVVVITRSSNKSEHVANEVAIAFEMIRDGLTIMPIVIEDVDLSDNLYYYLCRQERTNATRPPIERQIRKFVKKVIVVMGKE